MSQGSGDWILLQTRLRVSVGIAVGVNDAFSGMTRRHGEYFEVRQLKRSSRG